MIGNAALITFNIVTDIFVRICLINAIHFGNNDTSMEFVEKVNRAIYILMLAILLMVVFPNNL